MLDSIKEETKNITSATKEGKGGADIVKKKAKIKIKDRRGEISRRPRITTS
jgi:hypothetical protein